MDGMVRLAEANSKAHKVSADGKTILITKEGTNFNADQTFRYTASQGMVALPTGSASGISFNGKGIATDVSSDGRVIVGETGSFDPQTGDAFEAFRYTRSDGMTGLGQLGRDVFGWLRSRPNAISADGNVIVGVTGYPDAYTVGFRYTLSEGMIKLDDLPGVIDYEGGPDNNTNASEAVDLSADGGLIVGMTAGLGVFGEAVFWEAEENYAVKSLYDELKGDVRGMSEWSSLSVNAISDDGSTMVGSGIHNGDREAFVARLKVVPIPTALWLMGTAVFGLLGFRKSG